MDFMHIPDSKLGHTWAIFCILLHTVPHTLATCLSDALGVSLSEAPLRFTLWG